MLKDGGLLPTDTSRTSKARIDCLEMNRPRELQEAVHGDTIKYNSERQIVDAMKFPVTSW